ALEHPSEAPSDGSSITQTDRQFACHFGVEICSFSLRVMDRFDGSSGGLTDRHSSRHT
ncbi:hypothetical protein HAX54_011887, partial [Datura stramonium]|nr:hypothetical protein [Datura stramonium]